MNIRRQNPQSIQVENVLEVGPSALVVGVAHIVTINLGSSDVTYPMNWSKRLDASISVNNTNCFCR